MKKLIFISLICLMAGSAGADSIGSLDTTGFTGFTNTAGYYRGSAWTATTSGTLDSIGGFAAVSAASAVKYCVYRALDSSLVDSTIIDTVGPDTTSHSLACVKSYSGGINGEIKADSTYFVVMHGGGSHNIAYKTEAGRTSISESSHGQPASQPWENPYSGVAPFTSAWYYVKAFYSSGGEPPADTVISKYRDGNLRSGKYR